MGKYTITPLRRDLIPDVAAVASRIRRRSSRFEHAYFEWKYFRNPYLAEPIFHVALAEGRVVGMRGFYGTCWRYGQTGASYVLPAAADLMILEAHRKSGLYAELNNAALADAANRGYTHVLNLSASAENALAAILSQGWKGVVRHEAVTDAPPDALAPPPPPSLARRGLSRLRRLGGGSSSAFSVLERAEQAGALAKSGVRVATSVAELADVSKRVGSSERLELAPDEAYYRWRFENPEAEYATLLAEDGDDCGYVVAGIMPGKPTGFILDWRATTDELRLRLLDAVLAHVPGMFSIWASNLADTELAQLAARGFRREDASEQESRWRWSLLVKSTTSDRGRPPLDGIDPFEPAIWNAAALASDAY